MDIAHGETEGNGGTETEGMKVKAMASAESMKVKAMASTEAMKVESMERVEATPAVEGMAAVGVEVKGTAEGKLSNELGNALYRHLPSCVINGEHDPETAAPSRLNGHSASGPRVGTFFLTGLRSRCI